MADCPDCGRPLTHCFFPGDHVCLRVALNAARSTNLTLVAQNTKLIERNLALVDDGHLPEPEDAPVEDTRGPREYPGEQHRD
jgi:DNA-binding sugar fermentation-stimulating protein